MKTKIYFATAVALWDADFYIKVDDDVHVNIGNGCCIFTNLLMKVPNILFILV